MLNAFKFCLLILVVTTGFSTESVSASVNGCDGLKSTWEIQRDAEKGRGLKMVNDVLASFTAAGGAAKLLELKENNETQTVIHFLPLKNGNPINTLASKLQHEYSGVKLVFEPLALTRGMAYREVNGMFDPEIGMLWIGHDILLMKSPEMHPTLRHELVHAGHFNFRQSGKDSPFLGSVSVRSQGSRIGKYNADDYWRFMSFEEIPAMTLTLRLWGDSFSLSRKEIGEAQSKIHSRDFHDQVFEGFAAARALTGIAEQSIEVSEAALVASAKGDFEIKILDQPKMARVKLYVNAHSTHWRDTEPIKNGSEVIVDFPNAKHFEIHQLAAKNGNLAPVQEILKNRFTAIRDAAKEVHAKAKQARDSFQFGLELIDNKRTDIDAFINNATGIPQIEF